MPKKLRPARPKVIVTRRLPAPVEARMGELFDVAFNPDDRVLDRVVARLYDRVTKPSRLRNPSRAWIWLARNVPPAEFRARLAASDRSEKAVFETVLRTFADRKGKSIIGEKTPAHVRYGDTLLEWFPGGRIIHMLRDPRAIYVSDLRRRRGHPGSLPFRIARRVPPLLAAILLVQTTLAWQESLLRSRKNRHRHPDRYLVVRFEDLVTDPRREVERVCRFIGIPFEEGMMDRVVVSHGHALGSAGFDAQAAERWRGELSGFAAWWFRTWLGRSMRAAGYAP